MKRTATVHRDYLLKKINQVIELKKKKEFDFGKLSAYNESLKHLEKIDTRLRSNKYRRV